MVPKFEKLEQYNGDIKKIVQDFKICSRTARRWLIHHNIYNPRKNFGPNKLNKKKAKEIRARHNNQDISIKELAKEYQVTFATISRILHNITYPEKDFSRVYVVHNPKVN